MLTVEQVLENNSENENILISITEDNWENFATLLHEHGYKWRSGNAIIGDTWDFVKCFNKTLYHLIFIKLDSKEKVITYNSYEDMQRINFFQVVNDNNYFIIKPFEHLAKEIEELTQC